MQFKEWLTKIEGLTHGQPPLERPDANLRQDAMDGNPQALPTYDLPGKKFMKKASKKKKR